MNNTTTGRELGIGDMMAAIARHYLETGATKADVLKKVAYAAVEMGIPASLASEFAKTLCAAGKTLADAGVGE